MIPNIDFALVYIIIVYGLTASTLWAPIRIAMAVRIQRKSILWRDFLYCPICVGTWLAIAMGWLGFFLDRWDAAGGFVWVIWVVAATIVYKGVWPDAHIAQGDLELTMLEDVRRQKLLPEETA